ncbi:MAG: hypothetical protein J07HR59_00280 [Halorubrum sp. J07HR59]|jgi:Protein of unknown function (DUF456).|nr:MAG: hypothetical protein J07HR59_00280 [Halorubrum sp. J07HR59]
MVETILLVSLALLGGGVIGSVLPVIPSGLLSGAGLVVYQVSGPGLSALLFAGLLIVAGVGVVLEQFAAPLAAKATGASNRTTLVAAVAGFALLFVAGPLGIFLGLFGVVFLAELVGDANPRTAARRSLYTVGALVGSSVAQLLVTGGILAAFVWATVV